MRDIAMGMIAGAAVAALFGGIALFFSPTMTSLMHAASSPTARATLTAPAEATLVPSATTISLPTFTATPTSIPVDVSVSVAATGTPDSIQSALNSGSMVFAGPLSDDAQIALYRSSLNYVRSTAQQSQQLAKQINGVGYGDPSNICGPLAIAILHDAKLVSTAIVPHDFWLLNPNATTDARILEQAFPWDRYAHVFLASPINEMDWHAWPLMPGDFLFIWHGSGGNFDHMLVVTRVDSSSRAYTVTNYGTAAGFVIAEALLYDPSDPSVGLFHQWTAERDAILGSTGFGGFEVWRRRAP